MSIKVHIRNDKVCVKLCIEGSSNTSFLLTDVQVLATEFSTWPTSASCFWGSQLHRSQGCICNGTLTQRGALNPDSALLAVWRWECLDPRSTRSCSRLLGKTTVHLPNTPTYHCRLLGGANRQEEGAEEVSYSNMMLKRGRSWTE